MEHTNLKLFEITSNPSQKHKTELQITEKRPLASVLQPDEKPPINIYDQVNSHLDSNKDNFQVLHAREVLKEDAESLSDNQVQDLINNMSFLVESWLEEYERTVFDGKTLNELLHLNDSQEYAKY